MNVAWAPGQDLSHQREGAITLNGTAAYYGGGHISQDLVSYYPGTDTYEAPGQTTVAGVLGLGVSSSVEYEISSPLFIWGSVREENTNTRPKQTNQSVNSQKQPSFNNPSLYQNVSTLPNLNDVLGQFQNAFPLGGLDEDNK